MSVSGSVMWAELQGELSETGLDVVVGVSAEDYPWPGEIEDWHQDYLYPYRISPDVRSIGIWEISICCGRS